MMSGAPKRYARMWQGGSKELPDRPTDTHIHRVVKSNDEHVTKVSY